MLRKLFYASASILMLAIAYHLGAAYAKAQSGTAPIDDIAMLTGTLPDGGSIPLPTFSDGSSALESECQWTASTNRVLGQSDGASEEVCLTEGRVVHMYNSCCGGHVSGTANYMIVAIRRGQPAPAAQQTFGQLKAQYRR